MIKILEILYKYYIMSFNKEMLSLTNMMSNLLLRDPTIIQKVFRGYLARKCVHTISSKYQTKIWRQRYISNNQKDSSSEKYQRRFVEKITGNTCPKCIDRINLENYEIIPIANPMTKNKTPVPNGFEYTEDFDGKQIKNDEIYYYNLKFITEGGGAQTRSLREVYHFVKCQIENIKKRIGNGDLNNIYFVNILDGDLSHFKKVHFDYLLNKVNDKNIRDKIFVGDMHEFNHWFNK